MSTPIIFLYTFRMYETKLKELETDIAKKTQSLTDLKQLVRQATEREQKVKKYTEDLEQQASNVFFSLHDKKNELYLRPFLGIVFCRKK